MKRGPLRVLISGAGIAGSTLADLLGRDGHDVLVVERDQGVRSSGNPVDVRGHAFRAIDALGLLPDLRAAATEVERLVIVDDGGRPIASMRTRRDPDAEFEVLRADLCGHLIRSAQRHAEFRFDDSVSEIASSSDGAHVTFEHSPAARFDLIVGADGVHSRVRRLVLGPEASFVHPLRMYVATVRLPDLRLRPDQVLLASAPGAAVALHPGAGTPGAAFIFRSPIRIDARDPEAVRNLLSAVYGKAGWRVPELLDAYFAAADTYFDAVCRVRTPSWSRGPVVLLGDAASCITLFGEGSSAAITGAWRLAKALRDFPDIAQALRRYESAHRVEVLRGQRFAPVAARVLVPSTSRGIKARNGLLRSAARLSGDRVRRAPC
jgi:2-polyprenyl-6-methoxyphenol hydroxylase-like FAD-dependent oxidoreductase